MCNSAQTVYVHTVQYTVQEPEVQMDKAQWLPHLKQAHFQLLLFTPLRKKSTLRCSNASICDFQKFKELKSDQSDTHIHTHTPIKYTQQFSEWEPKKWIMEIVTWKPVMPCKRWTNSPLFITASWKVSWQVAPWCSPLLFWCQTKLSDKCVSTLCVEYLVETLALPSL